MKKFINLIFLVVFSLQLFSVEFKMYIHYPDEVNRNKLKGIEVLFNNKLKKPLGFKFVRRRPFDKNKITLNYILDLRIYDFYSSIKDGIINFIDKAYDNMGVLILITQKKVYMFLPIISKENLKKEILNKVKEDTLEFKAEMKSSSSDIKKVLIDFLSLKSGVGETPLRTICMNFISDFMTVWGKYKTKYLKFDRGQILTAIDYIDNFSGDTYYIGIYHREVIPYYDMIQKSLDSLQNFISSAVEGEDQAVTPMISAGINRINKSLMFSDEKILSKYKNEFLIRNISYNVILVNNKMKSDSIDGFLKVSPDYESFVSSLATYAGGIKVVSDNIVGGLDAVEKNIDNCLLLRFNLGERDYSLKIKNGCKNCYYADFVKKDYLKRLSKIKNHSLKLRDFKFLFPTIQFKIDNFQYKEESGKKTALLDVRIVLINKEGDVLYNARNILQVFRSPFLKIPLRNYQKNSILNIYIGDLFGKKSSVFSYSL